MDIANDIPDYEPKLTSRFYVKFPDEIGITKWQVSSMNKPKYNGFTKELDPLEINFVDPTEPSTSKELYKLIKLCRSTVGELGIVFHIETLDAKLNVIEDWAIEIGEIIKIDFGDLSYQYTLAVAPRMIIKPSICYLT